MFKRILVPLDGSPRAERALLVAARIARASGAELVLARVVEITPLVGYEYQLMPVATEADLAVARVYLAGIAKREELSGLEPRIEVIEDGNVGSAILDAAARLDCDLLVLCSHGRSGIKRWAL